jgi:hypothetical protein
MGFTVILDKEIVVLKNKNVIKTIDAQLILAYKRASFSESATIYRI